jgi:hypothetical protein
VAFTSATESPSNQDQGDDTPDFPVNFNKELTETRDGRSSIERIWDVCGLLIEGHQNLHLIKGGTKSKYQQGFASRYGEITKRSVFVFNRILSPYRFLVSRLSVVYPSVGVSPAGTSYDNVIKASVSEEVLRWYWSAQSMERKWHALIRWLVRCGNGGLHAYWSPELKEVVTKVVSPYDFFWEDGVMDPHESEWYAVRSLYKRDKLKKAYPEHAQLIGKSSVVSFDPASIEPPKDRVEVFDVYFRDGRHGILFGSTWLWKGTYPKLPHGIMPAVPVRYTIVQGVPYGIGAVQNVIDPQLIYNRKANQITDGLERYSDPKVLIERGSEVESTAFHARGSEKIFYDGPHAPTYLHGPGVNEQAMRDLLRIDGEIGDIMGIHSTSLGKTAKNVSSGAHVDALTENDVGQLQMTQEEIERAAEDHASVVLAIQKKYYTENRSIRMFDEAMGRFVFRELKGTDIVDVPEVFVEGGSMFRDGIIERRQKVLALVEAGVMTIEEAAVEVALGTRNKNRLKKLRAMRHSVEMVEGARKGYEVVVLPSDDLEVLEEVAREFMQEEPFYDLSEENQKNIVSILTQIYEIRALGGLEAIAAPKQGTPQQAVPPALAQLAEVGGAAQAVQTASGGPLEDPMNPNPPIIDGIDLRGGTGGTTG